MATTEMIKRLITYSDRRIYPNRETAKAAVIRNVINRLILEAVLRPSSGVSSSISPGTGGLLL